MKYKELPSIEYLNECLNYDPSTGVFTWKERPLSHFKTFRAYRISNSRFTGKIAGEISGSHIRILGYYAHRIAWKIIYEIDPKNEIDHINLNKLDNRICNLREADRPENSWNTRSHKDSFSKFKGVSMHKRKNKWISQITKHGKHHYLGEFKTEEEAHNAYSEAAYKLHNDFARIA